MSSQWKGWKVKNSLKSIRVISFVKWLPFQSSTLFCTFFQGIIRHSAVHLTLPGSVLQVEWHTHKETVIFQGFLLNIKAWVVSSSSQSSVAICGSDLTIPPISGYDSSSLENPSHGVYLILLSRDSPLTRIPRLIFLY